PFWPSDNVPLRSQRHNRDAAMKVTSCCSPVKNGAPQMRHFRYFSCEEYRSHGRTSCCRCRTRVFFHDPIHSNPIMGIARVGYTPADLAGHLKGLETMRKGFLWLTA